MIPFAIQIKEGFNKKLRGLETRIRPVAQTILPKYVTRSGTWINSDQSIITAYMSLFPTGNFAIEESIDVMLHLAELENSLYLWADISRSEGEIIFELPKEKVIYRTNEEIVIIAEELSEKADDVLFSQVSDYLRGFS